MNPLLRRLTSTLPTSAPPELRREWSSFLIHGNVCAVPAPDLPVGTAYWQRGCFLLLLDAHGAPTHLAKLRPEGEPNTTYEGEVLRRLWSVAEIRPYIPAAHWASAGGAQFLLTAYFPGQSYLRRVGRLRERVWVGDMRELLRITHIISIRSASLFPEVLPTDIRFDFVQETESSLQSAVALGLAPDDAALLATFLRGAGSVARAPQHGDLWPGNLLLDGDRWHFVDFEMFGKVQAPLFDALHLLRTSLVARAGVEAEAWLTQAERGARPATMAFTLLIEASRAAGLDLTRTMACIVFYLSAMAHRVIKADLPAQLAAPILLDLHTAVAALRAGHPAPRSILRLY